MSNKKIPIDKITEKWKVMQLEDVVEINKESRDPTREIPNYKFLYIDIESVEGGTGIIKIAREILGKEAPSRARRIIHQNDVIMSTVRPYLKAFALVPREYNNQICSTGFAVLSCKNEISPRYLLYTLFSKKVIEQCNKMMMGGQYPAINQSQVAKIQIPLPPLPEQRRIAEVLGTVDSAIQKVGGAIERTEHLKKGLMQRLLTNGIGHEIFRFSKELGCEIPEEWDVVKLGEVTAHVGSGLTPRGGALTYLDRGIPLIRSQNVLMNKLDLSDVAYISQETHKYMARSIVLPGDLLLNITGASIGRVTVIPKSITEANVNQHVCSVRFSEVVIPVFASYYLSSTNGQHQIMSFQAGATRQGLNYQQVKSILLPLPPLPEQRRIAEILSAVDRKMELERRRKEKLERVKKGLMNELLTGRKRVKAKE